MSKVILPSQLVPVDIPEGVDPIWFEKFQQLTAFVNLFSEIDFASMTTGQVLIWNATTKKFTAGAN
jgi:hypothetical protein